MPRPQRREGRSNTSDPSAGDQTVPRRIRGIVAIYFANVFIAARVAHERRHALDQLRAIFRDDPSVRFEQLIHVLPTADAVIVGRRGPRQAVGHENVAELLGDRGFRGAMRKGVRRQENFADIFAAAAFKDSLRQHARRKAALDELAIGDDTRLVTRDW